VDARRPVGTGGVIPEGLPDERTERYTPLLGEFEHTTPGSHASDHTAVSLLGGLGRHTENPPDHTPGNPRRPGPSNRFDDLTLTSSAVQDGPLQKVFLDRALVGFRRFVRLKTLRQLITVIEDVLD
jgi:hypothetical protein